LVHLAIVAHILHWWVTGRSVGRFVLSDSMRTLELGEINPGFLLFVAALIVSLIAGRFLCGWACHMGALQDLSGWLLRRMGVRPKMFRARFLGYVPLALAVYMFVWPTLKRAAVVPLLDAAWPTPGGWVRSGPFPGLSADFTSSDLWSGLPGWTIAVPFFLISGFAMVYFLGARGLCRYVCPYGGFFFAVEKVAPARVIADPALCDQCGLCTAACTAGVRVHEAVLRHGAVLDGDCMRSLDCVSVCPSGALAFDITMPTLLRGKPRADAPARYDLTLSEEFLLLVVFALVFLALRGAYGVIPMLLAASFGVIAAFLAHKAILLARDSNVRLGGLILRRAGRVTPAGAAIAGALVIASGLVVQAAAVKAFVDIGARHDDRITVTLDQVLSGISPAADQRASAREALAWYARARPFWEGGFGLITTPTVPTREAWMHLVLGEPEAAIERLQSLIRGGFAQDHTGPDLARLLTWRGRSDEATATMHELVVAHPRFHITRETLAWRLAQEGKPQEGDLLLAAAVAARPRDASARAALGRFRFACGRGESGLAELARAAADAPRDTAIRRDYAMGLFQFNRVDDAVRELAEAGVVVPAARAELNELAANMLRQTGRHSEAAALQSSGK
jgi:ferredoxin/tetratricopeptide (TPR) repeat protein